MGFDSTAFQDCADQCNEDLYPYLLSQSHRWTLVNRPRAPPASDLAKETGAVYHAYGWEVANWLVEQGRCEDDNGGSDPRKPHDNLPGSKKDPLAEQFARARDALLGRQRGSSAKEKSVPQQPVGRSRQANKFDQEILEDTIRRCKAGWNWATLVSS